jgi:tetratricopeptide (TPR) repeat protein
MPLLHYKTKRLVRQYLRYGVTHAKQGNHKQAIEDFSNAIQLDPQCLAAYYNRGITHGKLGHDQQAFQDFTSVLELHPRCAGAYYGLGVASMNLGDEQRAKTHFQIAARLGNKRAQKQLRHLGIRW